VWFSICVAVGITVAVLGVVYGLYKLVGLVWP
jgi:hypothetical protein